MGFRFKIIWKYFILLLPFAPFFDFGGMSRICPSSSLIPQIFGKIPAHHLKDGLRTEYTNQINEALLRPRKIDQVIKDRLTGLQFYNELHQDLLNKGKEFVLFQESEILESARSKLIVGCIEHPDRNPFCEYLDKDWVSLLGQNVDLDELLFSSNDHRDTHIVETSEMTWVGFRREALLEKLISVDLSELEEYRDTDYAIILKNEVTWNSLRMLTQKISENQKCYSPELFSYLGQKAEYSFPNPVFKKMAIQFYSRVNDCAKKQNRHVEFAQYRLGLLHIWDENCQAALPILEKLTSVPNGQFRSRSYYWRAHCSKNLNDKLTYEAMKSRLIRENPIGYHLISLDQKTREAGLLEVVSGEEPSVQLRSRLKSDLNPVIEAVEILQEINEHKLARKFIDYLRIHQNGSENEFRLYIGLLADRNHDTILKFRILSDLFEKEPSYISKLTMGMYFPLEKIDIINSYNKLIDPYLIMALVRQESSFNENAKSKVGALGLMQLMPATAQTIVKNISNQKILKPEVNIKIGIKYFLQLLNRFDNQAELALAAYNAGPNRVESWLKRYPVNDRMLFLDLIPYHETRNYVALIGRNYFWYLMLYAPQNLRLPNEKTKVSRHIAKENKQSVSFNGIKSSL